jgi:hypothetical protein
MTPKVDVSARYSLSCLWSRRLQDTLRPDDDDDGGQGFPSGGWWVPLHARSSQCVRVSASVTVRRFGKGASAGDSILSIVLSPPAAVLGPGSESEVKNRRQLDRAGVDDPLGTQWHKRVARSADLQ